jgi:heptosyltransferase-1
MKILVIKPSSLGDVIHALRVMSLFTTSEKRIELHWVIKKGLEGIVEASGWVDRIFFFERGGGVLKFWQLGRELRRENYDFVLDLQGLGRSAVLSWLACKQSNILGRADGREFSTFFYRKRMGEPNRQEKIHAIERLLPFVHEFGIKSDSTLHLDFRKSKLSSFHKKKLFTNNSKKIFLFPESRRPDKIWPGFLELANELADSALGEVVVLGNITDDSFSRFIDLRGGVELHDLPALVEQAAIVVCNDSAPLHLASAMNKPLVALFGPTDSNMYGPYPSSSSGVELRGQNSDISKIEVRVVLRAVKKILQRNGND